MTESDAGVLTHAGQAHAVFVTQRALMVVEVCMALGGCEKAHNGERDTLPKICKCVRKKA